MGGIGASNPVQVLETEIETMQLRLLLMTVEIVSVANANAQTMLIKIRIDWSPGRNLDLLVQLDIPGAKKSSLRLHKGFFESWSTA